MSLDATLPAITSQSTGIFEYDPHFSNVSLLLHFEGALNSTVFTDSSEHNQTITRTGVARLTYSTGGLAFGGMNLALWNTNDVIAVQHSPEMEAGSDDFTVELRCAVTAPTESQVFKYVVVQSNDNDTGFSISLNHNFTVSANFKGASAWTYLDATQAVAVNGWNHYALVKSGLQVSLYVNGIRCATETLDGHPAVSTANTTFFGGGNSATRALGNYDEIRVTKRVARYAGSSVVIINSAFPDRAITEVAALLPAIAIESSGTVAAVQSMQLPAISIVSTGTKRVASVTVTVPSMSVTAKGHDSTGERAANVVLPMLRTSITTGANLVNKLPRLSASVSGTSTIWGVVQIDVPALTTASDGRVSGMAVVDAEIPSLSLASYCGAYCAATISNGFDLYSFGITGGIGGAQVNTPSIQLNATATINNYGGADISIPFLMMGNTSRTEIGLPKLSLLSYQN